jgi:hypothetical protein
MGMKKCKICGEQIDTGACNQEYGVWSMITDSDKYGTKIERVHLCGACASSVTVFVATEIMKRDEVV